MHLTALHDVLQAAFPELQVRCHPASPSPLLSHRVHAFGSLAQGKLAGRVTGSSEGVAVEGQVSALLDEARDPENLCRMFDGWASWL